MTPAVNLCYDQSSMLLRNTLGYINGGARSIYAWTFAQNTGSARHGLVAPDKTNGNRVRNLMYDTLRDFYARALENNIPYTPTYTGDA